jgi:hypothetical protein
MSEDGEGDIDGGGGGSDVDVWAILCKILKSHNFFALYSDLNELSDFK